MSAATRREVLAAGAATGVGMLIGIPAASARTYQANEKLDIGVVGVANRGGANLDGVAGENIVALCDVDSTYLDGAATRFTGAAKFADFRRMLDKVKLDAVVCSTADHTHATVAASALRRDLHVYCEKPLAHTVHEVRTLTDLARRHQRVTQMGTQIHAGSNYRRVVELVRAGAIGAVNEVHVWCGGGYQGGERPTDTPPVPATLDWDLWLGPAPYRPYHPRYVPFVWRGWWEFGNGTLGDMACHHMDLPFWALNLGRPKTIEAEGPTPDPESTPPWLIVRYAFPQADGKPDLPLTWYNGDKRPPQFAEGKLTEWGNGTLFVGSKGMLLAGYDSYKLFPEEEFKGYTPPAPSIPESIGHHAEWIEACKGRGTTTCTFDYSGPLAEAVLLGCVAYRSQAKIDWDYKHLKARGCAEADHYLRKRYRKGWKL